MKAVFGSSPARPRFWSGRTTSIAAAILIATLALALYSVAQYYLYAAAEARAKAQYDYLINQARMTDLNALVDHFTQQQFAFIGVQLPGTDSWTQHSGPFPVDWENFPEELTRGLIGYWDGDVPVYEIHVFQDRQSREIVFLNSEGQEIYSLECPYNQYCDAASYAFYRRPDLHSYNKEDFDFYVAHLDPARVNVTIKLVPSENLYDYLYSQALEGLIGEEPGGGGMQMMMSGGGGSGPLNDLDGDGVPNRDEILAGTDPEDSNDYFRITAMQLDTNNSSRIYITWPSVTSREYSVQNTTGDSALLSPQNWNALTQWLPGVNGDIVFTQDLTTLTITTSFHHVRVREKDANTNDLPDWWEIEHFGGLTNIQATGDQDGDGLDNLEELYYGYDPTQDERTIIHSIFYVVQINTNDPADPNPDDGTERFDFHGGGRPLSLASGAVDQSYVALTFSNSSGGIYFNNDISNLYIGVSGLDVGGNNALAIFLDSAAGGVTSLRHLNPLVQPYGFSRFTNINFDASNFTPNVGILLGGRFGDGRNHDDYNIGDNNVGQGVYNLTNLGDFSGFNDAGGCSISQFGTNKADGTSPNRGAEVALSLAALSASPGDTIKAACLFIGGTNTPNGNARFSTHEAYAKSITGSAGFSPFTLIGSQVRLASAVQTLPPNTYPGFSDDDVMLQAFYWNVPVNPHWHNVLTGQVTQISASGFSMIWLPPAYKGANPGFSVGYDPYDHYDIGSYNQGGGSLSNIGTRYGMSNELAKVVQAIDSASMVPIEDIVLNHMAGGGSTGLVYNYPHHTFEKSTNDFHPSIEGHNDALRPYHNNEGFGLFTNFDIYGADVAFLAPNMRKGMKKWGQWLANDIGFQAWRFDFTEGVEPWVVWEWLEHPGQRGKFAFMEYWEDADGDQMREWLDLTGRNAAIYDWYLRDRYLKPMCENNGAFDMRRLESPSLLGLEPEYTVVFIDNHDTFRFGDTNKIGITTNKPMAYAYAFHSQGLPLVFYHDYYEKPYLDSTATNLLGSPLSNEVNRLIRIRKVAVAGDVEILYSDTNLYIQLRSGSASDSASILIMNDQPGGVLFHSIQTPWTNTPIIDLVSGDAGTQLTTSTNGTASLGVAGQAYRIYAPTGVLAQVEQ